MIKKKKEEKTEATKSVSKIKGMMFITSFSMHSKKNEFSSKMNTSL